MILIEKCHNIFNPIRGLIAKPYVVFDRVQYRHIYEDRQVSLGIFSFSAGASIPLHDHPGMVVISRSALNPRVYTDVKEYNSGIQVSDYQLKF